jgi:hypothetical protein
VVGGRERCGVRGWRDDEKVGKKKPPHAPAFSLVRIFNRQRSFDDGYQGDER